MIDWNRTKDKINLSENYFIKFPNSGKKVYRICDECKQGKWVNYQSYRNLCKKCKMNSEEVQNKINGKNNHMFGRTDRDSPFWVSKITLTCKYCGEKFDVIPSKKNTSKFCNKKCMNKWKCENNIGKNNPFYGKHHTLKSRILNSCTHQEIDVKDFIDFAKRNHVLPEHKCTKLNSRFPGSEMHHIMSSVVIYVPKDIHNPIYHDLKNNKGMREINKLAFNYLVGNY